MEKKQNRESNSEEHCFRDEEGRRDWKNNQEKKKKTITIKEEDKQVPVIIREETRRYEAVKVIKYSVIDLVKRIQGDSGLEDKYLWTCE